MTWVLALLGCRAARDEKLAELPLEAGDLVAVFPPDGAPLVFGDVPVEVVLGAASEGRVPAVRATRGGVTTDLSCQLLDGGNVADCGVLAGVGAREPLALDVTAGADHATVATGGRAPRPGIGWDLFDGVSFEVLGGGSEAVGLANDELRSTDSFGCLDGYDGTPGDWTFVAGPVSFDPDGTYLQYPGFAFLVPVTVAADGTLTGEAHTAWLPFDLDGAVIHVLLLDVRLRGRLVGDALRDLRVDGTVPALGLEELVSPLGSMGSLVLDAIDLDVDRDGDGEPDAASVRLVGTPSPASIWD